MTAAQPVQLCEGVVTAAGESLRTVVVAPAGSGSDPIRLTDMDLSMVPATLPMLLWRSPYGIGSHLPEAFGWARRGCAVVLQDVRGRYGSTGEFTPYRNETCDGLAAVDWIRDRGFAGELIAYGGSYAAHCALAVAGHRPLAGVLVSVPAVDHHSCIRERNGAPRLFAHAHWWSEHGDSRVSRGPVGELLLRPDGTGLTTTPVVDLPRSWGLPAAGGFAAAWCESSGPVSADGWWRPERFGVPALLDSLATREHPAPPLLCLAGWFDGFAADALALWHGWPHQNARLLIGPWAHDLRPPTAQADYPLSAQQQPTPSPKPGPLASRWATDENGLRSTICRTATSAASTLAATDAGTPPAARWRTVERLPRAEITIDLVGTGPGQFRADPDQPHPSRLGHARIDDLLDPAPDGPSAAMFVSDPLVHQLEVLGSPRVQAYRLQPAGGAHRDWAVRLAVTHPGIGTVQLGTGCERTISGSVAVAAAAVHLLLPAGSRLIVQLSAHQFPLYPRDPQTGESPLTATHFRTEQRSATGTVRVHLPFVKEQS